MRRISESQLKLGLQVSTMHGSVNILGQKGVYDVSHDFKASAGHKIVGVTSEIEREEVRNI